MPSSSNTPPPLSPQYASSPSLSSSIFPVEHRVPLNPAPHSKSSSTMMQSLPSSDPTLAHSTRSAPFPSQSVSSIRSRAMSVPAIRPQSILLVTAPGSHAVSTLASLASSTTTLGLPIGSDFCSRSNTRSRASSFSPRLGGRSVSPSRNLASIWRTPSHDTAPPDGDSTSWRESRETVLRPWSAKTQKPVTVEQIEGYVRTRERVAQAAVNVLGVAAQVTHELLEISIDVLQFAPLPGLAEAARTLLTIWDALLLVDINRRACLTLTERCATILISIREEIAEAGDEVSVELHPPLSRLVESYREVHRFLVCQTHRSFIKRYLQRDEVQRALAGCDRSLTDALGMFNTSIQIRILKQVIASDRQRQADTVAILDCMHTSQPTAADGHFLAQLEPVTARKNERDTAYDAADLRQLLRGAIQSNSDADMIEVLQIGRDEMPELIKTPKRAVEIEVERQRVAAEQEEAVHDEGASLTRSSTGSNHTTTSTASSLRPIPLPLLPPVTMSELFDFAWEPEADMSHTTVAELSMHDHEQLTVDLTRCSSCTSQSTYDSASEHFEFPRDVSPPPPDEHAQDMRDERRYRMLLQHEFHPSLTLPLWTPSPVALGAVGYHSKADGGAFVTLFNAFDPAKTSGGRTGDMPSLYGYGRVSEGSRRQDKRTVGQRGKDIIQSWIGSHTRPGEGKYSRRYSSPLRAGHKTARLFTESSVYRYLDELSTARKWLKANAERVLALYGLAREELVLVIGTLDAQDYALFVSHEHPDGNVDFDVFAAAGPHEPWGEFSFSTRKDPSVRGPTYDETPAGVPQRAYKVSDSGKGGRWDTVLVARLRLRPDQAEPTSL